MKVLVIGLNGIGLMPTTPRKARLLLKNKKAKVYQKYPFTIKLLYKTGSATQPLSLGIDTGESHIGVSVANGNEVIIKTDIELRKSMDKRKLMEKRAEYRHSRRYRKTRYRHPKFRFQTKRVYNEKPDKKGRHWQKVPNTINTGRTKEWLPPSIQSKVDHHINWINKYVKALPKNTKLVIEVARFDVQHMMDPFIRGELYRRGRMYGYENVKAYVLAKFGYKCPICGHKFDKEHKPQMHHITYKSKGATDNPDEYAPVCSKCHVPEGHKDGKALDKLRRACKHKEYREPTFMNILRKRLFKAFPDAVFTYGNITNADRKRLMLPKDHANDAVAIAMRGFNSFTEADGNYSINDIGEIVFIKQVRHKKRSLHEANPRKGRKEPNRMAKRNNKNTERAKGFRLWDKIITTDGTQGYITGFTGDSAYIVSFEGNYIFPPGKRYKQHNLSSLIKLQGNYNWI